MQVPGFAVVVQDRLSPAHAVSRPRLPAAAQGYGVCLLLVLGALGLAMVLRPHMPGVPLAAFLIAVSASTWFGGLGPGLAATALSGLSIDYFLESPYESLVVTRPGTTVDLLVFLAAAIAISAFSGSLQRARARAELATLRAQEAEQHTRLLAEFGSSVSGVLEPDAVLATVGRFVVPRFANWCTVHLRTLGPGLERMAVSGVVPEESVSDAEIRHALETGNVVSSAHAICVPLQGRGQPLGVLTFGFDALLEEISDGVQIASDIAQRAAIALDYAQLYRSAEESRDRSERVSEHLLQLNRLAMSLSESVTLAQVGEFVIQQAMALTGSRGGRLYVVDPNENNLQQVASVGVPVPRSGSLALLSQDPADAALLRYVGMTASATGGSPRAGTGDGPITALAGLVLRDRTVGVLELVLGTAPAVLGDDAELLSALAQQGAQALERARLYEAERQARSEMESANAALRAVQAVTDTALAHLDLDRLLHELLERVRGLLSVDLAAVLIISDDGRSLIDCASVGALARSIQVSPVPIGRGVSGQVAQTRQPLIVDDLASADVVSPVLREAGVRSFLGVPLLADGAAIGVLHVDSIQPRHFTQDELHLLGLVADRIARGINHARLYMAEQRARSHAERLAAERTAVLAQIADGVVIADAQGEVTFVNEAARQFFGAAGTENNHLSPIEWLPDQIAGGTLRRALAGEPAMIDLEVRGAQERIAVGHAAPVQAEDGRYIGAVLTLRDVTAERTLERRKDEFFSNVSHDLRTPVATIKGAAEVVLQNEPAGVPESLHRMLQIIDDEADRLSALVDNLLELSRVRSGQVQLQREVVDLRSVVDDVARSIEPLAMAAGQHVVLDMPATPVFAAVDAFRVERALQNLVGNAQKYGRHGGTIALQVQEAGEQIRLIVSDDGPGIPREDRDHVFDRFYRSSNPATRKIQGSGLGLPIARAIAELHGGKLELTSAGKECTFTLVLPRSLPQKDQDEDIDRR